MTTVRRRRRWPLLLSAACAITVAASIGAGCGIDAVGLGPELDDGGISLDATVDRAADTTVDGDPPSEAGVDAAGDADAARDADADANPCVPTGGVEICDDGRDNNCDGKLDCDDTTTCSAYACASTEANWSFVTIAANADAGACPTGWGNPRVVLENVRSEAGACDCSCGVAPTNPCTNGAIGISFDNGNNCNQNAQTLNANGECHPLASWDDNNTAARHTTNPPAPVVVPCPATAQKPAIVHDGARLVCDLTAKAGSCAAGACVTKPTGSKICLMRAGVQPACPAGYGERHVVMSSFTDDRTCGACSCLTKATTCSSPTVTFGDNAGCGGASKITAPLAAACTAFASGDPAVAKLSYRYSATPDDGKCYPTVATSALGGAITPTGAATICCQP